MNDPKFYARWAIAMMEFEGYYEGSVSFRNNNPGNVKDPDDAGIIGHDVQGHAIFDAFPNGWRSLVKLLTNARAGKSHVYRPEMTLLEFYRRYAEGNAREYAKFVAGRLGATVDTRLEDLK